MYSADWLALMNSKNALSNFERVRAETDGTKERKPHNEILASYVNIYNIIPHMSFFVSSGISTA